MVIDKNAGCCGTSDGIVVNQGGTMTLNNSSIYRNGGSGYETSSISVNAGGHLVASNTSFSLDDLYLNAGLVLNSGDLTGNVFSGPLYTPVADQPLLTNNQSFGAVYLTGSVASGQSVVLVPIGTKSTANQYYVMASGLGVSSGGTLTIGTNASVTITDSQFLSVSGQLNVIGASVAINKDAGCCGTSDGILINYGGTMAVSDSSIYRSGTSGYESSYLSIASGGTLTSNNSAISLDDLYLNSGSSDQLNQNVLGTALQINNGAVIGFTDNDFTNATVVASGSSTATITLANNFWGTTDTNVINGKITDQRTNTNLPTVNYTPYLSSAVPPGSTTTMTAANASAAFSASAHSVNLTAGLTSTGGTVSGGSVTFTIVNGANIIGTPVTVAVSGGTATASYSLPANLGSGNYLIQVLDLGTPSFSGSVDVSHSLTIGSAPSTTAGASTSIPYSAVRATGHAQRHGHQPRRYRWPGHRDVHAPQRLDGHRLAGHRRSLRWDRHRQL